jgi:macrolide-specific efflux system membrane fusion protein
MKSFLKVFLFPVLVLTACTQPKGEVAVLTLNRGNYSDTVIAAGTIRAVRNTSVMAARDYYGNLTVDRVLPEGSRVEAGDTICVLKCEELVKMLDERSRKLEILNADLKKLEADNALNQAVLEARLKENQAGLAIHQLDSIQMKFAPPVRKRLMELELAKARIEERKLLRKFEADRAISEADVRKLRSRILQAENEVKGMDEKVRDLTIRAGTAGILTASEGAAMIFMLNADGTEVQLGGYPKPGENIWPELPLMSIPDITEMEVKMEVDEMDYKRIEQGQKVEIMVDAASGLHTTGKVGNKSLAAKMKYRGEAKLKYYEIIAGIDSCHTRMMPGLSARCIISITEVRDTVVMPTPAVFEKDSIKVVYVADGKKFRIRPVVTGLSNSSQTIISAGLKGNETIALIEPPPNLIEKRQNQDNE